MSGSLAGRVAVVTDSTADLPPELAARYHIRVVPLQVAIGDRCGDGDSEVTPDEVARALLDRQAVQTSRPSPARFEQAYADARAAGASGVVVVTMSAALSGTYDAAYAAASTGSATAGSVRCVDSRTAAMGLGFAVLAAGRDAAAGGTLDTVADAAAATAARTSTLFYVDTLEYLRRGGRIGRARALVGAALAVKPILHIEDGEIALLEKVRTASRARARLVDLAVAAGAEDEVDVAVHHAGADEPTAMLNELRERIPHIRELVVAPLGAAITAHVGPGVLGVVVSLA
jgi:DegV family protein with EDD domain